jgi:DNA invertase Pin-like site-specific DNA recombinase
MRAPDETVRCGIYARISLDAKETGDGVARQVAECEELAARKGWSVVERYIDNSISASNPKKVRPEFERLLTDMAEGRLEAVLAWHPDRLYRRMTDLDKVAEAIGKSGVQVATVKAGDVDFSTASGRQIAAMMAVIARGEVERLGERLSAMHDQRAARGEVSWAQRAFGWRWEDPCPGGEDCQHPGQPCTGDGYRKRVGGRGGQVPDEKEAPILREMYERVARGDSLYAVCCWLNDMGSTGVRGSRWGTPSLRESLRRTRNAGFIVRKGVESPVPDERARIVSRDLFDDVQAILNAPGRQSESRARAVRPLLVQGLAVCGDCGPRLSRSGLSKRGLPTLMCSRGGPPLTPHFRRAALPVDEFVLAAVQRVLATNAEALATAADAIPDTDSDERRQAMADLKALIADANRAMRERRVSTEDWLAVVNPLRAELEGLEAMRERTARRPVVAAIAAADDVAAAIAALDEGSVRALMRELISKVEVWSPGRGTTQPHNGIAIRWQEWTGLVDIEPVWLDVKGNPRPRPEPWSPPSVRERDVRRWALAEGLVEAGSGRIPKRLYEAYTQAHGMTA